MTSNLPTTTAPPLLRPAVLLRLEGAGLLIVAILAYAKLDGSSVLFLLLLLAPDLSMLVDLINARLAVPMYNLFHTTTLYLLLAGAGLALQQPLVIQLAL